jgi:hypothetical protein
VSLETLGEHVSRSLASSFTRKSFLAKIGLGSLGGERPLRRGRPRQPRLSRLCELWVLGSVRVLRRDRQQLPERQLRLRLLAAVRRVQRQVEAVQGLLLRMRWRLQVPRRLADVLLHRAVRHMQRL